MPNKPITEAQIGRLLGLTTLPIELTLCVPDNYQSSSTSSEHMTFYRRWRDIRHGHYDGLIVTGAPVELLPFESVSYWSGLCAIFDWARKRAMNSLYICWSAQAALYHFHGVMKHILPSKLFGVFRQRVIRNDARLTRGFGDYFPAPVSRYTEIREAELPPTQGLAVLISSRESGICLIEDQRHRATYMFNHLEYDADTLGREYKRDVGQGKTIDLPQNYYPGDDPQRAPINIWRPHGRLFFSNWLSQGLTA
jgi:homoserine O-succinyltransferase